MSGDSLFVKGPAIYRFFNENTRKPKNSSGHESQSGSFGYSITLKEF
jgi:hypothetical protein